MSATAVASRHRAILDAALGCFNEQGVTATTIEDVRARSGASVGSIYHHFGSKEGLAEALYLDGLGNYQRGVLEVVARRRDAEAGIRAIVRHHLRWVAAHPPLARFLLAGREPALTGAGEEALRELNRPFFAEVAAWVDARIEAGEIARLPFDVFYAVVLGPAQELSRHWLAGRTRLSLREAERPLGTAAWHAVRAQN